VWQHHAENSFLTEYALELDPSANRFGYALHDGKAEAEALGGTSIDFRCEERLENLRLNLEWYAFPMVADGNLNKTHIPMSDGPIGGEYHASSPWRCLNCVRQQVVKDLMKATFGNADRQSRVYAADIDLDVVFPA
jgi:hypothetical protein